MTAGASSVGELQAIAARVRRRLGVCRLQCVEFSIALRNALRRAGFPAIRVYGFFLTDGVWDGDAWGEGPVEWFPRLPRRRSKEISPQHMDHNWVAVGDLIVDIGAEQFNPLLRGEIMPSVYIARARDARRYVAQEIVE